MAIGGYTGIITDGLVFAIDPYNIKSYVSGDTTVNDMSTNSNNGTLINGVGFADKEWIFDGSDDYIDINNDTVYDNPTSTFECWIKPNSSTRVLLNRSDNTAANEYVIFQIANNQIVVGLRRGTGNNRTWKPSETISTYGIYYHLVVTKTPDTTLANLYGVKIYMNGVEQNTSVTSDVPGDGTDLWTEDVVGKSKFWLGVFAQSGGAIPWDGSIGLTNIYNRVLTADEIKQNYDATKWRFK